MITSANATKSINVNGYNPSFDKLKLRTKKNDKIYYRTVTDPKTGEVRTIENRLKDKPLFSRTTREVYGYYMRLHNMGNGFLCPTINKTAEACACSRNSVINANDELTKYNLIGIQRTGRSNDIIIVPLDDDGFPIESSAEFEVAKALNSKYRSHKNGPQKSTKETSEVQKVDFAYNNKRQSNRELKKLERPHEKPPSKIPKFDPAGQQRAVADGVKKIRAKLPKNINDQLSRTFMINAFLKHGLQYMLWLANECQSKPNPQLYFCKGVHHREDMNKYDRKIVREGETQEVKQKEKHAQELDGAVEALSNLNFLKDMNEVP